MAKVIVIGGGPAGMMAAIKASERHQVVLLEKNEKLGKKLFISGKGRCNLTNAKDIGEFFDYIPRNPQFLYSALYNFTNQDTMKYFEELGVKLKVERGDRVFPFSDKSSQIISALERKLKENNVLVKYNSHVIEIKKEENKIQGVKLKDESMVYGDYFIITTGGASYPLTGSNGEGFKFAKALGIEVVPLKPSLTAIECVEPWIKELQGLSLKNVELTIKEEKKIIFKEFGEMIFTHFGISGPIVLSGSSFVSENKNLKLIVNLKPALTKEELDKRVLRDFTKYCNKDFKNALDDLLPKKLIDVIIGLTGINENKKVNEVSKEERKKLVDTLQNLTMTLKGLRPLSEAIVTSGGVNVKEINPSTMQCNAINNLYFAGEVIDIDAYTGGFNIQIALSTGYLAGTEVGL